jgi:excinuclease ABC subunit C
MTTLLNNEKLLPHAPGVYLMRDSASRILYIGKALDLRRRVGSYFRPEALSPKIRALMGVVRHVDYISTVSEREALVVEQRLIHRHQPDYNTLWKDGKTYPYVKLSLNEDFPRLSLTRQRKRDGARYFGPYPSVSAVRNLLSWVWKRRLFPLRPCAYDFSMEKPLNPRKIQSCLYFHTGECPAPCAGENLPGKISPEDYRKIADRAALFFEGKNTDTLLSWEKEMKSAADLLEFEKAAQWRDRIEALKHMGERVTFRALREEDVQGRILASQSLQELQAVLGLPRPPLRIEAFDISHLQGTETVASMVTFDQGRPLKSHYRKFKIRSVHGVDDFASMEEVVFRRYKRVKEEGLPWPDLILVDGGPGQLSAALKALRQVTDKPIPLASLAKRQEEIYLPGRATPVRLSRDSSALHILQHVRDESHRFAITFHLSRRERGLRQPPHF